MLSLSKNINKSVLDTGFGDGAFLNEIIKLNKSKEITGIELDEEFYTKMKNNNIDNCNLINEDYLSYEFNKKFDLIIGNPPYITNDNLPFKIKEEIKKLSGSGEGNIYYAFILKSIETLKENGELIYIVPYDFFFNTYAKQLRNKLIKDGYFDTIIDFGETNIFKGASPEIIIFKWIKNTKIKQKINVYKLNKSDKLNILISNLNKTIEENNTNIYFNNFEIENFKDDKIWSLSDFTYYKNTKRLADLANVGVGIVNGAENIFFIKQNDLNKFTIKEKEMYIKTFIKSKNVNNCVITDLNNSNYIFINNDLTEDELKKSTNVYNYLKSNKEFLNKRYISGKKQWFHYLAIRNLKLMKESKEDYKIIVPNITRKDYNWFSITKLPHYIGGDVLMIKGNTKEETLLLFAILNSEYFINFYKEKGAKKGNRIIFNQKILKDIEIPYFEEKINKKLVGLVEKMLLSNDYNYTEVIKIINKEIENI